MLADSICPDPVLLAGMANISLPELAAAVSNAGGMGIVGGAFITPDTLRKYLRELKALLVDPALPFGVDLLLPAVGGSARATNKDYTRGALGELVDIMIEEGASLFVCAVGTPPIPVVERLHDAGIMVMNMVGSPKHVIKALDCGVDAVCAQGTEAGGHTGDVATTVLIPQCVDICKGRTSPLTGGPIAVVGAGGIYDGRGMAAALALGSHAVWIGTRFVAATEAAVGPRHQRAVIATSSDDTVRTTIFSGRPMRVMKNDYIMEWETTRQLERDELLNQGKRPYKTDLTANEEAGTPLDFLETYPNILGQASGGIDEVLPAKDIVHGMVAGAFDVFRAQQELLAEANQAVARL